MFGSLQPVGGFKAVGMNETPCGRVWAESHRNDNHQKSGRGWRDGQGGLGGAEGPEEGQEWPETNRSRRFKEEVWSALFSAIERSSSKRTEGTRGAGTPGALGDFSKGRVSACWGQRPGCSRWKINRTWESNSVSRSVFQEVQQLWIKSPLLCIVCLCVQREAVSQLSQVTEWRGERRRRKEVTLLFEAVGSTALGIGFSITIHDLTKSCKIKIVQSIGVYPDSLTVRTLRRLPSRQHFLPLLAEPP